MAEGDHIYASRRPWPYSHHGIDCGDGTVIHFIGEPSKGKAGKTDAAIARTPLSEFASESRVKIRRYRKRDSSELALMRAQSQLGVGEYHLVFNNCEHFATWCATGQYKSRQVRNAVAAAVSGTPAPLAVAAPAAAVVGVVVAVAVGTFRGARKARG